MTSDPNKTGDVRFQSIGVLGAGSWGTVVAMICARGSVFSPRRVYLFDRESERMEEMKKTRINQRYLPGLKIPSEVILTTDLEEVFRECVLIAPIVPSVAMRSFSRHFSQYVRGDHFIVHGTKGFEPETHKRMSEVIIEETGCLRVGALSGPNLAGELAQGLPGASLVASPFDEVTDHGVRIFSCPHFKVIGSKDLKGVELVGALKNILALAAGFCDEMKLGQNAVGMILTQGLREVQKLIIKLGGDPLTMLSLAGFGDIIATSTSRESRNFRAGQRLARGMTAAQVEQELRMTVEGFNTLRAAHELGEDSAIRLEMIRTLMELTQGAQAKEVADRLVKIIT